MWKIYYNSYLKIGENQRGLLISQNAECYTDSSLCDMEKDLNHSLLQLDPKQIGEIVRVEARDGFILTKKP